MNKTFKTLLLILTAIITVITIDLCLGKLSSIAKASSPVQTDFNQTQASYQSAPESPVTDLVVDAMEVTQSVQDLKNTVPLVMGKRTYIRVYVHSTDGIFPTTAVLKVQIGGSSTTLLPIPPGGPFINVRQTYNRLIPSHAFLFELPVWFTYFSPVTLTAEINPQLIWHPRNPEEYSYSNNTISKTYSFDEMPPLNLVIASQPYKINGIKFSPSVYDMWSMSSWIQRAYPIGQVKFFFRTLPTINAQRKLDKNKKWVLVYPNCSTVNSYLAYNRASILGNPFFPDDMGIYALVSDTAGFMRGCASVGGYYLNAYVRARVASGPSGSYDWGWDFDGSYADWYGGHELGHAYGQAHVKGGPGYIEDGCGGEADSWKNYPDGRISPTLNLFDPNAMFGFDYLQLFTHRNPILGPNWHDVMTYCDYQWISGLTYTFLESTFKNNLPLVQPPAPDKTSVSDVLAIFGSLEKSTGRLSLQPTSVLYSVPDVVLPPPGNYAIVLRDADGIELARYPFSPAGLEAGQSPDTDTESQYAYISELVPYVIGTVTLQIEGPSGNILAQVNAGTALPDVQITSPVRGAVEDGSTITVTWTASDPDGDPLTFNIDYSPDAGVTWQPAGLFYTATQAVIDQVNFPATDQALIRVWASDGMHTTRSTSESFIVPNHLPVGEIVQPSSDITVAVSQTVAFEAQVYDIDLGNLDGTDIQWFSNRDGTIGNGAVFNTDSLSVGVHTITMTAMDGQGGVITDQVMVTVVPTPNDLPVQPDGLSVGPDPVFLSPSSGVFTATVYVDNFNLENPISWEAVSDQPWLHLSNASGTTPGDLTITADYTSLDFGTHTAILTFTTPQVPDDRATVRVVLTIPHYATFIPLAWKK